MSNIHKYLFYFIIKNSPYFSFNEVGTSFITTVLFIYLEVSTVFKTVMILAFRFERQFYEKLHDSYSFAIATIIAVSIAIGYFLLIDAKENLAIVSKFDKVNIKQKNKLKVNLFLYLLSSISIIIFVNNKYLHLQN